MKNLKLKIYTRFDSKSCIYLDICRKHTQQYFQISEELWPFFGDDWKEKITDENLPYIYSRLRTRDQHLIQAITFGAMCLEAFIYDYAANNFSDTYVKNYLDKLDMVSKWVLIPKLTTGKEFPTESKAFEGLKLLVKARNDLVHSKSLKMPFTDNKKTLLKCLGPRMKKDFEVERKFARFSSYDTVIEVLTELRKLEGEEDIGTQWWQLEESDVDWPF